MKVKCSLMLGLAGIVCFWASNVMALSTADFRDDFEAYTNGQPVNGTNGWGSSSSEVLAGDALGYNGTKGVMLPIDATISNQFTPGATKVWSDFFVRPAFFVPTSTNNLYPTLDTNSSAMFYFNSNGYLMVADLPSQATTNWLKLTNSPLPGAPGQQKITESAWTRVSVLHQYAKTNFSVFINGILLRDGLTNVNKVLTQYEKFQVYNGAGITAYVDQVNVITSAPPADLVGDYDGDNMRDAWEIHFFGSTLSANTSTGDPDGDGFKNGEESAANSDPNDPLSMPVTVGLPYYEGFDNRQTASIDGKNGWTASVAGNALVQTTVKLGATGKALSLVSGTAFLTNIVNSVTYTSIWADFVIKSTPDVMYTNSAVALYVNGSGNLNYYDGSAWASDVSYPIPAGNWARIVIHENYISKKYSIWVSTNASDTNALLPQVVADVTFIENDSQYRGLAFVNSAVSAGYLDNVSITLAKPNVLDTDGDKIPDSYEDEYGLIGDNSTTDGDGDGMTDRQEHIAGTDPNDPASYLRILSLGLPGVGSAHVRLVFNTALDADIIVLGSSNPSGARNVIGSFYTGLYGESNAYTHANGALSPWYFYQVASSRRGSGVTNTEEFVAHMQSRNETNRYYFISVPIGGMDNMAGKLGEDLKTGLAEGDSVYFLTGGSWKRFDLESGEWIDFDAQEVVSNYPVAPGTGMRILRRGVASAVTRANFFGPRFTNATVTVSIPSGWTFRAWPYDTAKTYAGNWNTFGFPAGAGGTTAANSGIIWAYRTTDGALISLRLASNGKWYYYGGNGGVGEAVGLQLNGGFFYNNQDSGGAESWVPQRP